MRYLLASLVLFCGCTLQEAYVAADVATYEAIAPAFSRYVEADESLDDAQKARRHSAVTAWKARITEGSK